MIRFSGEISGRCLNYYLLRESKVGFLVSTIVSLFFILPILILAFKIDIVFLIGIPCFIVVIFIASKKPSKQDYDLIVPIEIIINDTTIESISKKFHRVADINYVKKVIDMGDWYHICFYFPYKDSRFICQKSLILYGTIEEFESLFANKIERKQKR